MKKTRADVAGLDVDGLATLGMEYCQLHADFVVLRVL